VGVVCRCHVVIVCCRLGNNDIVALCFDGRTRVVFAWGGGGAISDKPLPYDTCEVLSLAFAVDGQ